jgi:hypothetical protein
MSDIKIQPSATGSATVTLTAPVSNTARTITFPDSTGTLATTTDVSAKLSLTGGTLTGNIVSGDNVKATYGTLPDMEIYHDGNNSLIKDIGQGGLFLCASQVSLRNAANSESGLVFAQDGAVTLYHNNVVKVATTSTGVSITGTVSQTSPPAGSVLQVIGGSVQSQATTTGAETDTGLTATITPSSTSSKILVMVSQMGLQTQGSSVNARLKINLYRGATNINSSDGNMWPFNSHTLRHGGFSIQNLDSPSTTSAVTYKTTFSGSDVSNAYVQKDSNSGVSSIILMEIAG